MAFSNIKQSVYVKLTYVGGYLICRRAQMGCKLKNLLFQDLPIILIAFFIYFFYLFMIFFVTLHRK